MSKFDALTKYLQKEQNVTLPNVLAHLQCSEVYARNLLKRAEAKRMVKFQGRGQWLTTLSNFATPVNENDPKEEVPDLPKISVAERFGYITDLVNMVVNKTQPAIMLTGTSGVGKSHLVMESLEKHGLKESEDFRLVRGHTSPLGLYQLLHDNRDSMIVLDDADSAFRDDISANLLKAALDSYDKRFVSWHSSKAEQNDLERYFEFTGQVIFISNMPAHRIDPAIRSRSFCYNLYLTPDEIVEYMQTLLPKIEPKVNMDKKQEVLDYLKQFRNDWNNFNLRTLIQAIRIRSGITDGKDWKTMIRVLAAGNE